MDTVKVGQFLAELRHEHNYTQEQLGKILGVSNKTISRWENGNYLPPVEMLMLISEHYSISVNEMLSGKRLLETEYKKEAEENIKAVLKESAFSVKEKVSFFKRKWIKERMAFLITSVAGLMAVVVWSCIQGNDVWIAALIALAAGNIIMYNRMMIYVEQRAYDGSGSN